jgi:hypothetical protein
MTDTLEDIQFVDLDLGEMLKDSSDGQNCSLDFVLRYSDPFGKRFVREATMSISRIRLHMERLPPLTHHAIVLDSATKAEQR